MLQKLLNTGTRPGWITDSFPYIQAGLVIIIALCCVVMIIGILASPPEASQGSNVVTGASESYYTKNRSGNNQGRIRNLIIICASIIAICAILFFISVNIYEGGF